MEKTTIWMPYHEWIYSKAYWDLKFWGIEPTEENIQQRIKDLENQKYGNPS